MNEISSQIIIKRTISGVFWKMLQGIGAQIVNFVVSIILARLLSPNDYGVVALVLVFTNVAMVFINTGFSSAIVQRNNLEEKDVYSMFYIGLVTSILLYSIIFWSAKEIAYFYRDERLILLLRFGGTIIPISSFSAVQQSLLTRQMKFRVLSIISIIGSFVQGIVGIVLAFWNYGAWSLIISMVVGQLTITILIDYFANWQLKLKFSIRSIKKTYWYSLKLLISELLNTLFNNIRSIIIGFQYSTSDLAYYNKGYQFPTLIMTTVDGAMTSVLFSTLSKYQSEWENQGLNVLRKMIKMSMYVCAPLMVGLFSVARPLIITLMTEKWINSVIYVRLVSIICLFWPLSARRHALNARGYAGVSLGLNLFGKILSIVLLLATYKISIIMMISSTILVSFLDLLISAYVYNKYLSYPIVKQYEDIIPYIVRSIIMGACIYPIDSLKIDDGIKLIVQIIVGMGIYILLSAIKKDECFIFIKKNISLIWRLLKKHRL